jgi:hypothetical protein
MDDNPYKPPLANQPNSRRPAPMWRRIVSLPLIIFGLFLVITPTFGFLIVIVKHLRVDDPPLILPVYYAAGGAMIWGGLRLRRSPPTDS